MTETPENYYGLELRGEPVARGPFLDRITRIPSVEHVSGSSYLFGPSDEDGIMSFDLGVDGETVTGMELRFPRGWAVRRGPQVFAFIFMAAEWARWEVYDVQLKEVLRKEVVLGGLVAMREAKRRGKSPDN